MHFDEVFSLVGGFGTFQFGTCVLMLLGAFFGTEVIDLNYVGYDMEHWCQQTGKLAEMPYSIQKYVAIPYTSAGSKTYSSCQMYDLEYDNLTIDDFLHWNRSVHTNHTNTIHCQSWQYNKDIYVQNSVSKWNLVCGDSWKVDLASSVSVVGIGIGALANGPLAERFGRKVAYQLFMIVKVLSVLVYSLSPWWWLFVLGRLINGAGTTGIYVLSFVIIVETVGPRYRNILGIGVALSYSFGFMAVPAIAYFIRDALPLQLVHMAPALFFFAFYWIVPESPRWLLLTGRHQEAEAVLRQIATINGRILPDYFTIQNVEFVPPKKNTASYMDLVRYPELRRRTLILSANWLTDALLYFALSLNAGTLSGDIFLNTFLLGAVEVPAIVLCMYLTKQPRFGRKYTNFFAVFGAGIGCLACIPFLLLKVDPIAVTVLSLVGKAGAAGAFAVIYIYTSELYPTETRNLGIGACSLAGRFSGVLAPYAGGPLANVWRPLPDLIFGVAGTLSGLLTLLLPETLGQSLPETIADVEGYSREMDTSVLAQPADSAGAEEMGDPIQAPKPPE